MRIVFLTPYPVQGGGNRVVAKYAEGLAALGHEVTVVSSPRPVYGIRQTIKSLVRDGQVFEEAGLSDSFIQPKFRHVYARNKVIVDSDLPECDVVVATWWETAYWLNSFARKPKKSAYFMQDYGVSGMEMDRLIPTWFMPFKILTIAPWMERLIKACNPGKDVAVIENGIDEMFAIKGYRTQVPSLIFGHVYSNFETKGSQYVLEAFRKVHLKYPQAKLLCFGGDKPKDANIPGVEFLHKLKSSELVNIYAQCRCWLFASRAEGFGLPILEAFAAGTPVIATPVGIAPDILSRQTGILLDGFDSGDIAGAMEQMIDVSDAAWLDMSRNCLAIAKAHDWESRIKRFESELLD